MEIKSNLPIFQINNGSDAAEQAHVADAESKAFQRELPRVGELAFYRSRLARS